MGLHCDGSGGGVTRRVRIYLVSAVVFAISFGAAWLLPIPEVVRGLAILPGFAALANIVFTLWRDERAHERAVELQTGQQDFALATASHMANRVYDRHVTFCEAYVERTNRGYVELLEKGPTKDLLMFASELAMIRMKHATWLTAEIETKLIEFEAGLRKIGASESRLESLAVGEERTRLVDEIFEAFLILIGESAPTEKKTGIVLARVIDHLRDVLGITQLTQLRLNATSLALARLSDGDARKEPSTKQEQASG
jgi:hypothetical protein